MKKILALIVFIHALSLFSQVTIKGISRRPFNKFELGIKADYLSNEESILIETISDSIGRFNFYLDLEHVDKLFIKQGDFIGFLYAQPKATYFIEFSERGFSNFSSGNEVELTFIQLDSLDINYKILTFENWLDKSLNILYPLKEKNTGEFLKEIKKFRSAVNEIYQQEKNPFFADFVKYSLGIHIEELQEFAAPNEVDKYRFYLEGTPVKWRHDKYFEFITNYYDKYFYEQTQEKRQELMHHLDQGNAKYMLSILEKDSLIGSRPLAEIVSLLLVKDLYFDQVITKVTLLNFLKDFSQTTKILESKNAATRFINQFNTLDAGDKLPSYQFGKLNIDQFASKPIYIQFFNPSNKKCIAELAAMKKLHKTYGNYIQFLTIYKTQEYYSKADKTYLEQIQWQKTEISVEHPIWKDLDVFGFPYYVYVLPNLIIGHLNALSPSPNGKYETIEKTLFEHKRMMEGEE
jgi:hypothetical protein